MIVGVLFFLGVAIGYGLGVYLLGRAALFVADRWLLRGR